LEKADNRKQQSDYLEKFKDITTMQRNNLGSGGSERFKSNLNSNFEQYNPIKNAYAYGMAQDYSLKQQKIEALPPKIPVYATRQDIQSPYSMSNKGIDSSINHYDNTPKRSASQKTPLAFILSLSIKTSIKEFTMT